MRTTYTVSAADADGVALAQTLSGADDLTLVSSSVTMPNGGQSLSVTTASNETSVTITVVGTDRMGMSQSYSFNGPNATTTVYDIDFATISQVSTDGATTGNVSVGWGAQAYGNPIPLNLYSNPTDVSLTCVVLSGSPTYSVQFTQDDVQDLTISPQDFTWFQHPTLTSQTTSQTGNFDKPVVAPRMLVDGEGVVQFIVLQGSGL